MRVSLVVCALALAILVAGCGSSEQISTQPAASDRDRDALASALNTWEAQGSSYTITYTATCGDGPFFTDVPITVDVDDGNAVISDGSDTGIDLVTVEFLFEMIESALVEGADSVAVSYAEEGIPTSVDIDWDANSVDDEFCVDISSFDLN